MLATINCCTAGIYKQPTASKSNTNGLNRISVIVALADALAQTGACKPKEKNKAEKKRHKCDCCGKTFPSASHLTIHKRTHTGEKPYKCNFCPDTFAQVSNLQTHERTHTGEKPYACDICLKAFAKKYNLITHKRTHTGEKPYECNFCKKCFTRSSCLNTHQKKNCKKRKLLTANGYNRKHTGSKAIP